MNPTQTIETFVAFLKQSIQDFEYAESEVKRYDRLTQDYLHMLELNKLTYHEKAHIAISLAQQRIDRRPHKDDYLVLQPLVAYLQSKKGQGLIDQLNHIAGLTRRAEQSLVDRSYHPRVLSNEAFFGTDRQDQPEERSGAK